MAESVLVIAPHPDDEAIGCGGAISLHRWRGDLVRVVFLTSGEQGIAGVPPVEACAIREAEALRAGGVLGVSGIDFLRFPDLGLDQCCQEGAARLLTILERYHPGLIYLPHPDDAHPDHEATLPMVRAACARLTGWPDPPELRAYEVWSPMTRPGWVEDITGVMRQKLAAIRCYRSQLAVFRYDRAVRGLNQYRGVLQGGSRYAEAFTYLEPAETGPNG